MVLPKDFNQWQRSCRELLDEAGIGIDGNKPYNIHVKNPKFYKRVLKKALWDWGGNYMDDWWEYSQLDVFFTKIVNAELQSRVPDNFKDVIRVAGARFINFQQKKGGGESR